MYGGFIAGGPLIPQTHFSPPRKGHTTTQQTASAPVAPVAAEQKPKRDDAWPTCTGSNPNNNTDPPLRKALRPGPASKVFIALPSGLTVKRSTVIDALDRDPRLLYKPLPKSKKVLDAKTGKRGHGPKSSSNTAKPVSRSHAQYDGHRRSAAKKPKKTKSSGFWDCFG